MTTPKQKQEVSDAALLIKQTAEATATALNIQYIQRDIQEIKQQLKDHTTEEKAIWKEYSDNSVSRVEHKEVVDQVTDHEKRIRALEEVVSDVATIKRLVFGVVGLILTIVIGSGIYLIINR